MIEPGASLVPHNDPTLLWINAGVAALKKYFDGTEKPKNNRITNAQKSIRTNDIENVGKTARHHTFFEMLGNFSIGDYFKKEAIPFAWHFLTDEKWMGFEKDKLYITVYIDDQEAFDICTKFCGVDPSHILKTADNFWEIGNGPCGPDTEIFYDRGEAYDPKHLGEKLFFEEMENDRYIEVWNVVFSQFNSEEGVERKDYKELPQKNIDTGMGLERLVCLVQGGETNFDTDLFLPIIRATEKMTEKKYEGENKMAYRVIADHIRTITFALADGALFSNEGRGYILRRVLRRAVRYGKKLDIKGAYMYKLVPVVADNMKDFYPYLQEKVEYIQKLVKAEEERFETTLNEGEKILQNVLETSQDKTLSGAVVFKLYDTYGFPLELTREIAEEKGFVIDQKGFDEQMKAQRERARNARADEQSMASQAEDLMNFAAPFRFVGYEKTVNEGVVTGLFRDGKKVEALNDEGDVAFDQSCFYAESGGQLYDTGVIENGQCRLVVNKVYKAPLKQFLHHVKVEKGEVHLGDQFTLKIDEHARALIRANHSSVHLLQAALQRVVGSHVHQAGSFVCADYARFDFTHFEKVSAQQLKEIEKLVNEEIAKALPVVTDLMDLEKAKTSGAMALFDEKYDDVVRVVSMGDFSKELCGGTHVANTSEIGLFKIVSEESIGSGIRRITSKTSLGAYQEVMAQQQLLEEAAAALKVTNFNAINEKIRNLQQDNASLNKTISELKNKLSAAEGEEMLNKAEEKDGLKFLIAQVDNDSSELKNLADQLISKLHEGVVLIYNDRDNKQMFVASCSEKAIEKGFKAGDIIKKACTICGGNGGGRPNMATGGGKDSSKVAEAVSEVRALLGL
jgi:alanyl-tRNA synthetase